MGVERGDDLSVQEKFRKFRKEKENWAMDSRLDNFYLVSDAIDIPSTSDGLDLGTCSKLRHYGAELIQIACILLGCQQVVDNCA